MADDDGVTRSARPGRRRLVFAGVVLGAWAALASLVSHVATLPRPATPLHQEHELYGSMLARTNDVAYMITNSQDALVVVSIPAFEVRARLPLGGSPTSVAWDGTRLLLALGFEKSGWALVSGDRWLVAPRWQAERWAQHSVFRDVKTGALVLATHTRREYGQPSELLLSTVGSTGELGTPVSLPGRVGYSQYRFCGSVAELYATEVLPGHVCRVGQVDAQGTRGCEPVQGARLQCANVVSLGAPDEVIGPSGRVPFVRPPSVLMEGDMPNHYSFRLLPSGGELPEAQWFSNQFGLVVPAGPTFLSLHADAATREHSRIGLNKPEHLELTLWDPGAERPRATRKLFGELFLPDFMIQRDEELVAYFHVSKRIARFRLPGLERADATDTIWAVRERLRPWGGASKVFELSLALGLCLGPALGLALFTRMGRTRWGRRSAIGYVVLALCVLYWTARRTWWL